MGNYNQQTGLKINLLNALKQIEYTNKSKKTRDQQEIRIALKDC